MNYPMFVIHGVANRDPDDFEKTVSKLQERVGDRWELFPVFWGDLGGETEGLFDTLFDVSSDIYSSGITDDWLTLTKDIDSTVRSDNHQIEIILEGASIELGDSSEVRSSSDIRIISTVIREEMPKTHTLKHIQQSELLLEIGHILGSLLKQSPESEPDLYSTRYDASEDLFSPETETRASFDKGAGRVRALFRYLDRFTGKLLDKTFGQVNQNIRRLVSSQFVHFFGDVFAYQGGKEKFHKRLRDCIERHAPGWGYKDKPVSILAHSLGGVLSFDAAVIGHPPIWIDNFITVGSQSSFFHIVDSRAGIDRYNTQQPVELPERIKRWFNLWEPLDFLAFSAEHIFRFSGDLTPRDIPVLSPASRILTDFGNTHGVYWESEELLEILKNVPIPDSLRTA